MKWYLALNDSAGNKSHQANAEKYEIYVIVALLSAKLNAPNLSPHLIYNGMPNRFTEKVQELGCTVIHHRLSFESAVMEQTGRDELWKHTAKGAMLRLDIPIIDASDDLILYTDTDIMYLDDPSKYIQNLSCEIFSAAPEFDLYDYTKINTGVLLINFKRARRLFNDIKFELLPLLNGIPDFDQGAIRLLAPNSWSKLNQRMNWKPYWGLIDSPIIVHFHGPKPLNFNHRDKTIKPHEPDVYKHLYNLNPSAYFKYLSLWHELFMEYHYK